ncbi:MAG: EAL domain-containing protein [Rhodocyclaceae bacterium]|nr:EAL domain-containing protein [Rhodocyclaceae bacterium]
MDARAALPRPDDAADARLALLTAREPDLANPQARTVPSIGRTLLVFFTALIAAVWIALWHQYAHLVEEAETGARRDVANLSLAFAEHIRALANDLDRSLLVLRDYWGEGRERFHLAVVHQETTAARAYKLQIAVIDRVGRLAYSSLNPDAQPISLEDREHFRIHRDSGRDALFISKPVLGRVSGKWSIQFTRPILAPDGSFGGVLVISVDPDYFSAFYTRVDLGKDAAIDVYRANGEILARSPAVDMAIGADAHAFLPTAGNGQEAAVFEARSAIDAVDRIYGVRELPELGLSVAVGMSVETVRAGDSRRLWSLVVAGSLASLVIAAFALTVLRNLAARSEAAARIAHARERDRVLIAALEAAPSGVVVTDAQARIGWANKAFCDLTGYALGEILGQSPATLLKSGKQSPEFYGGMWRELVAGNAWRGELINRRKDGSTYAEELIIAPVQDDQGFTTHYVGIKQDITARKAAERAFARESQRSQLLLRMAGDGIVIVDMSSRIVEASNACAALLGYARDELLCMRLAELDERADPGEVEAQLRRVQSQPGESVVYETRFRSKHGVGVDVEVHASVALLGEESLIFLSFRDVTERRQLIDALAESEQRWKFALDGSGAGVYDWNLTTGALSFSDSALTILELDPGAPIRCIADWEVRIHPMDAEQRMAALEACLGGLADSYRCEYRYRVRGRIWKWVESRGALIRRARDGAPLRLVGTFQDVDTAKREADQAQLRASVMEALTQGKGLESVLDMTLNGLERNNLGLSFLLLSARVSGSLRALAISQSASRRLLAADIDFDGPIVAAGSSICMGEPVDCEAENSDYWCKLVAFCAAVGLTVCWSEPLVIGHRRLGALVALCDEKEDFAPPDLLELQQSAALLGIAIQKREADEALRLAASVYEASSEAVMVVDARNRIVAINPAFTDTTGYGKDEVLGKDPSILSSGRHDAAFYRGMWAAVTATGSWQGEIWNRRRNGEEYIEWLSINTVLDEAGKVLRRVAVFSDVSERKAAEALIWRQANFDPLTGLPNRQLFSDRMQQALDNAVREAVSVALLFIDLDHFKDVNDTLGHEAGDSLLRQASERIVASVRGTDSVARLGGDEFTVLLYGIGSPAPAERIAETIVRQMAEPFLLDGEKAYVTCSIGITLFPADGRNIETLFKQADQAMYAAKSSGRNHYCWFTPEMQHGAQLRRSIANDLRIALQEGQMVLHYQPIVDAVSGEVVKAEALLRWNHPERGQVSPAIFIPIAEEAGVISELGEWVFNEAASCVARWAGMQKGRGREPIAISVNKSPRQFQSDHGQVEWMARLREQGLDPSLIIVEITEGVLLDDRPAVTERIARMRAEGVRLALDDFGTGYSAMSYLQRYEIDFIKIDRSFVRNLATSSKDRAISEAIIVMAHKLGIEVIGEGVEEEAQAQVLKDAGCDYCQGFLLGRPMPAAEFEARYLA